MERSDLGNPSIHEDFASGDEATVVGGQEADHLGDIGGNSIPPDGGGVGGLREPAGQLGEGIGLASAFCWAGATIINKRADLPLGP